VRALEQVLGKSCEPAPTWVATFAGQAPAAAASRPARTA
jgi:hypothetical protein